MKENMWFKLPTKKIKRVIFCKSCGKKLEVQNFNRKLCKECGYRGDYNKKEPKYKKK